MVPFCSRRTIDCDTETFSQFKKEVSHLCSELMSFIWIRAEFWVLSQLQGFVTEQDGCHLRTICEMKLEAVCKVKHLKSLLFDEFHKFMACEDLV